MAIHFDQFTHGYLDMAIKKSPIANSENTYDWSADHSIDQFTGKSLRQAISDCKHFQRIGKSFLKETDAYQNGQQFWLARNNMQLSLPEGNASLQFSQFASEFGGSEVDIFSHGLVLINHDEPYDQKYRALELKSLDVTIKGELSEWVIMKKTAGIDRKFSPRPGIEVYKSFRDALTDATFFFRKYLHELRNLQSRIEAYDASISTSQRFAGFKLDSEVVLDGNNQNFAFDNTKRWGEELNKEGNPFEDKPIYQMELVFAAYLVRNPVFLASTLKRIAAKAQDQESSLRM
jgi:hypothetical protein